VTQPSDPSADPTLAFLMRASDVMAHGESLDATVEEILAAAVHALGAGRGVATILDRDHSTDDPGARVEFAVADPDVDTDDAGPAISTDFPLLVSSGGVERELGVVRFSWAERAFLDAPDEDRVLLPELKNAFLKPWEADFRVDRSEHLDPPVGRWRDQECNRHLGACRTLDR